MKRRTFIRVVSYLLTVIIIFGVLILGEYKYSQKLETEMINDYSVSYAELDERLENISLLLKKSVYATNSKKIANLATEIYSETKLALSALDKVSKDTQSHKIINRFLSQAGDYSLALADELVLENAEITAAKQKNLQILSDFAAAVSSAVHDSKIDNENLNFWVLELTRNIEENVNTDSFDNTLSEIESELKNYPEIVYEGPYSDYIKKPEPKLLADKDLVTEKYANEIANEALKGEFKPAGEFEENFIKVYKFSDGEAEIKISQKGGEIVSFNKNKTAFESILSYEQALSKAQRFLSDNGYINMRATYHLNEENICIINFAFVDGQTICYTDLIKVGVGLDGGEILFFEAIGYINNHESRVFETLATSEEEARAKLPPSLKVVSSAVALIPTERDGEIRCYEFLCTGYDNSEILVYINVSTLEIEEIFVLIKSNDGTVIK